MAKAEVHRTAIVEGDVTLAEGVRIGPNCVVLGTCGPVVLGPRTTLVSTVHVNGPIVLGEGNTAYPGASLGFAPQDLGFDPQAPGPGLVIGDRNTFREGVTIHRGKTTEPTRIGHRNFFMVNSHVGHDAVVHDHCIFANGALLAGHVIVEDRVIMAGNAFLHQFCRVGKGVMFSGGIGSSLDVPPWFTVTASNLAGSINLVGMRRNGLSTAQIATVKWIYHTMYRTGGTPQQALPALEARADDPLVAEYIAFIRASKRGICHGAGRSTRGTAERSPSFSLMQDEA
jgi:UDP-N-acetylglucosamine acyltransferase